MPAETAVTIPAEETDALPEPLVHAPPPTPFDKVVVAPTQSAVEEGEIADGVTFTVIDFIAEHPAAFV